jgi:hypothetical protein
MPSLFELSYEEILAGSESVTLEVRDRRNPEKHSFERTSHSISGIQPRYDYRQIFFLRFVSALAVITYCNRGPARRHILSLRVGSGFGMNDPMSMNT